MEFRSSDGLTPDPSPKGEGSSINPSSQSSHRSSNFMQTDACHASILCYGFGDLKDYLRERLFPPLSKGRLGGVCPKFIFFIPLYLPPFQEGEQFAL